MNKVETATLINAEGLEDYGVKEGTKGEITGKKRILGQRLVWFRPKDSLQILVISADRVKE